MKTYNRYLSLALLTSALITFNAACSKQDADNANANSDTKPTIGDVTDPGVIEASLEEKQAQSAAKADPSRPLEQYETLEGGNQLMATLISMGAMPMNYEEFAEKINKVYANESDAFKKRDLLNNLKPQLNALVSQAKEQRYVYTDHSPQLSEFDFDTMSYTLNGLPEKGSEFYFYDNRAVQITYSNADAFAKLKLTEEQARVVEEYKSKYRDMSLRVYMFMNDHKLGEPVVKAQIVHLHLIGPKGEVLGSISI